MLGPSFPNSRSGSSRRGSALAARVTGSNRRRTRTREPYVPPKSRPAAATAPASVTAGQQRRALRSPLGEGLRGDASHPRERGGATPKGTAGERRASGPRRGPVNARRVARRGAAPSTGPQHVGWHGRGGAPAPPSAPAATARFRSLKLRHCGLAGRRPSPAPPSSRPAAPAIFWGRHTCPGGEDGGAHHTHKTWLPFKTKTSRAAARRWHSPEDHMVTENSPSRVLICTCFCSHFLLPGSAPPPPAAPAPLPR